jgi:hypothetical protein
MTCNGSFQSFTQMATNSLGLEGYRRIIHPWLVHSSYRFGVRGGILASYLPTRSWLVGDSCHKF